MKPPFHNRLDAAHQLSKALKSQQLRDPLVLAIPRGGVVIGAVLARDLNAELDVVLSRKLRAPYQQEMAIGAVSEDGQVYLNRFVEVVPGMNEDYIAKERRYQLTEIARRQKLFRAVRQRAHIAGRSVIVTDDGIATGSTMIAALRTVKEQLPREVIVAVPVAPPERLEPIRQLCDNVICLLAPESFFAVGQYYINFDAVEDEEALRLLRELAPEAPSKAKI